MIGVEYWSGSAMVKLAGVEYHGIIERPSDGLLALSVKKPGSSRRQNIIVGAVVAVTVGRQRHEIDIAYSLMDLRAVELERLIEGTPHPDWAAPYFDPSNDKYHGKPRHTDQAPARKEPTTILYQVTLDTISDLAPALTNPKPASNSLPAQKKTLRIVLGPRLMTTARRLIEVIRRRR